MPGAWHGSARCAHPGWRGHHLPGEGTCVTVEGSDSVWTLGSPQSTPNITDRAESCSVAVEGVEVK